MRWLRLGLPLLLLTAPLAAQKPSNPARDPALDHAIRRLASPDTSTQRSASRACAAFGPRAIPPLLERLRLGSDLERKAAAVALRRIPEARQDAKLRALVTDKRPRVAYWAAWILRPRNGRELARTIDMLRTGPGREHCERLLVLVGSPAVPQLVPLLARSDYPARRSAIRALGLMGSNAAPAMPKLIELLADGNRRVALHACQALCSIGRVTAQELRRVALDADAPHAARRLAVRALCKVGSEPVLQEIAALSDRLLAHPAKGELEARSR